MHRHSNVSPAIGRSRENKLNPQCFQGDPVLGFLPGRLGVVHSGWGGIAGSGFDGCRSASPIIFKAFSHREKVAFRPDEGGFMRGPDLETYGRAWGGVGRAPAPNESEAPAEPISSTWPLTRPPGAVHPLPTEAG